MKDFSDDMSEMRTRSALDDATVEAILSGSPVLPEHAPLADVVQAIRNTGTEPVVPSRQLAACMAAGDFKAISPSSLPYGRRRVGGRARSMLAALSLRAKAATGVAVLFTGLTGATAAGALPDDWEEKVRLVIETVTPVSFGEHNDFGQAVAEDAHNGGVDGQVVSEAAKGKGKRAGSSLGTKPDSGRPDNVWPPGTGRPDDPPGKGQGEEGRDNRPDNPGEDGRENRPENPGEEGQDNADSKADHPDGGQDHRGGRDHRPDEPGNPPTQTDRPGRGN